MALTGARTTNHIRSQSSGQNVLPVRRSSVITARAANERRILNESTRSKHQKRQLQDINATLESQPEAALLQRMLTTPQLKDASSWALIAVLAGTITFAAVEPAMAAPAYERLTNSIGDLAEDTDFWSNVLRYISYFFSVLLGTVYVALKPLADLLKKPTTAVLVLGGVGLLFFLVSVTVSAMLGMNEIIDYEPSSIVTPMS